MIKDIINQNENILPNTKQMEVLRKHWTKAQLKKQIDDYD